MKLEQARTSCRAFYESIYTAVYLDAKNYTTEFECIHHLESGTVSSSSTRTRLGFLCRRGSRY